MRARIKRWLKRLLKTGGLFVLVGIGVLIGLIIGENTAVPRQTIIIHGENPFQFEKQLEIAPIPTIPAIPTIPPIPEIPAIPAMPTHIHIDHGPTFFEVVNGIGTVLASLGLIGLGVVMILRGRRQPKEKSPESLNK
jgi:hypothetical protein